MKFWKLAGNISDGYKLIIRVKRLIPNCNGSRSNTPKSPPRQNSCKLCQSGLLSPCPCSQSCMSLGLDPFLQDNCFPFSPLSFSGRRASFRNLQGKKKGNKIPYNPFTFVCTGRELHGVSFPGVFLPQKPPAHNPE